MRLTHVDIEGYKLFGRFQADVDALVVIVGANGTGKSCFFELLRFLRDGMHHDIPAGILSEASGQCIFNNPRESSFSWKLSIHTDHKYTIYYSGLLLGPLGSISLTENVSLNSLIMRTSKGHGEYRSSGNDQTFHPLQLKKKNQIALSTMTNPAFESLYNLRDYLQSWKFYSSFFIDTNKIRKSVPVEQDPVLHEDAGNLSAALHFLMTEHPGVFDELKEHLRAVVPGFQRLTVKARGGPGEVIAFWREEGSENDLSLADLSDGILRLLCWLVICLHPSPPPLVCLDEPDQGLHPRVLPLLAGLLKKASSRTQILVATHSSSFLTRFDISDIAVMRKDGGRVTFDRPGQSAILLEQLAEFGSEEIEVLHRSDELERL